MKNEEETFWEKLDKRRMGREREEKKLNKPIIHRIPQVYFISDGEYIKIGWTTDNAEARLRSLQTANARPLTILGQIRVGTKYQADKEKEIHKLFKTSRVHGEWFRATPELLAYIAEHKSKQSEL